MKRSLTLDGAVAAEIADFALEAVRRQAPDFAPTDVIVHLCGATAGILLGSLTRDQAIKSTEGWRLILIEAIKRLPSSSRRHRGSSVAPTSKRMLESFSALCVRPEGECLRCHGRFRPRTTEVPAPL